MQAPVYIVVSLVLFELFKQTFQEASPLGIAHLGIVDFFEFTEGGTNLLLKSSMAKVTPAQ